MGLFPSGFGGGGAACGWPSFARGGRTSAIVTFSNPLYPAIEALYDISGQDKTFRTWRCKSYEDLPYKASLSRAFFQKRGDHLGGMYFKTAIGGKKEAA